MIKIATIGHSNHSIEDFLLLLKGNKIDAVADVRSNPYSKYASQFSRENLKDSLLKEGIHYVFLGEELGARRNNTALYDIDGKVDFDKVAETTSFQNGLKRLIEGAKKHSIALMCSEKNPLDCHRTHLVAKYLIKAGIEVNHIMADGHATSHDLVIKQSVKQPDLLMSDEDTVYETKGRKIAYKAKN
ncbi:MAG: DUF488 domain-containing protein [PS1 clade bacterium]|uniref:DUF488 domain-containing protein n=1 Tax=PS1 clade bacterium TaxID=2175152 RepID=A0A937L672_9PROT|nr:DUF488 domain-containing protein [PS1 clade bacterium]